MGDSRRTHLIRLRDISQTRMNELEVQKARLGINCPPEILTEIEEIKKVLQQLDQDITSETTVLSGTKARPRIFLSNSARDRDVAQIISHTISRITLGQIEIISLRESLTTDEIVPVSVWFDNIQTQFRRIKTLITILTPWSITEGSIYFESGAAAKSDCRIIPLCIGIDGSREVPFPLSMYQRYQLSDFNSLDNFAKNLLALYDINFDPEMVEPILKSAITKIVEITSNNQNLLEKGKQPDAVEMLENIRQHMDRRFLELFEIQSQSQSHDNIDLKKAAIDQLTSYTVPIYLNLGDLRGEQFIDIDIDTSVQGVLDIIYFMIDSKVGVYTYLQKWILRERTTGIYLIMKEVAVLIPAKVIFNSKYHWEVIELKKPYSPLDKTMNRKLLKPPL